MQQGPWLFLRGRPPCDEYISSQGQYGLFRLQLVPARHLLRQHHCRSALPCRNLQSCLGCCQLFAVQCGVLFLPGLLCLHALRGRHLWRHARALHPRLQRQLQRAPWQRLPRWLHQRCASPLRCGVLLPGRHARARPALRPRLFLRCRRCRVLAVPCRLLLRRRGRGESALLPRHCLRRRRPGRAAALLLECFSSGRRQDLPLFLQRGRGCLG